LFANTDCAPVSVPLVWIAAANGPPPGSGFAYKSARNRFARSFRSRRRIPKRHCSIRNLSRIRLPTQLTRCP